MPRRKPKNAFVPGQSGNPAGRPHGSVNEINNSIRTAFAMLLHNQLPNLETWLAEGAKRDPLKTADLVLRISERFTPSLSKTMISDANGEAFTPITINIPNLSIGGGALTKGLDSLGQTLTIGEGAPTIPVAGHLEHLDIAVSKPDGHYEHLNSAVSGEIPENTSAEAPSQEFPVSEEVLENSPIFAPDIDTPLRPEDQFDPALTQKMFEEWKTKNKSL